ncbi:beta strand repeat-containing protein [Mesorhizobium cantuariense]|uniref:Beta strand repeat-containing protein n=1 Tax=Mesorhizobium cantuariense TaxID=1300275 RepID=A0ABV7MXA8_9HYPH
MGTTETSRQVGEMAARGEDFRVRAGYRRSRIARHLWKTTALTTLALGLSSIAAHGDPNGLWQPQIRAIIGADNNGGTAALEGFIPLKQTAESVLFLDVRTKHDFKDSFGQDVGLGIRRIVNPDLMIGGYAYLNVENHNSNQFTAATLGAEAITSHFDAHVNVYLPIKGDHTDHSTSSTLSMVSNQLMEQISVLDHRDYAAWGIEGEIGAQVPINLPDKHSLRLDIGGYHFEDPHGDDNSVTGAKAGFEYTIGDVFGSGTELVFAGEVRNDNRDDTQFAGSVRLNIPFNPGHGSDSADGADTGPEPVYPVSEGLRKRVNERVRGDIGVRIQSQTLTGGTTTRVAINAATNAAFGKFYYADGGLAGAGTLADPTTLDDAVTKAGSGGFVVALGGNGNLTSGGVTLANGQTVIGGGESVTAKLFGGGTSTFNLGGSDGTIQGTNVANPVITLGNGNTLNGITITGGGDGIFGNNVTGTKLTKVTVDGAGGNGAEFTGNSTNVTASDFTAKNNGLDGLHIEDNGTYNFTGTTLLQGNLDDGLDVTGQGTYTFATINALDNADRGITVQGTPPGSGTFTTTGGTISGNGGIAVFIDPITAHVVLDSITQTGGTSGVVLENVSGSFTVNGATTISNTTGPAIAISNSPAAIRFGDVNITNPGADGMSFAGVNAAVVAGNIVISGLGVGTGLDFSGAKTNFTAQSLNITGTGAAGSIGIDLTSPSAGGATIVITNGGAIANVDTGVRFGIAGSLANSANAEFTFGGGSIAGITASLDARGLNQTLGHYAFGSTTFTGAQLFDVQNVIFVGASATGSGTGSSLLDLASIATADANTDANAIFVLVNRGTAIDDTDGFSLTAGQTLASFGNGRTFSLGGVPVNVTGDNVEHDAAISDGGGAATLTSSAGADTVTLANNSSLLDFNVSNANPGGGTGIHGNNVSGVTISGVNVSGASLDGLLFKGASNVVANNVTSTGNASDGLHIEGDGTYAFNGTTTLSNNGGNGLYIDGDGTYAFQTLNASDNSGFGVNVLSTTGTFSTTDGTISGNGAGGVSLLGANIDVTLTSLTQDGGLFGAMFAGVSGNFAVSGATTVSNTFFGGLAIVDSTADFTFGAVDISDITAPGGIGIYVQNSGGAVTFGGPVTLTHIDSEGILATGNAGTLTFSGPVSMTDPGDGIWLEDNTGAVSFGGAVTIDQPFGSGIDVVGSNGVISFGDIDITGLCNCSTALDLSGSTSTFTAATLDVSGSSGSSSIGIDLSGTNGGSVTIGSGVITGVDTGVQMGTNGLAGTTANTAFSFGAAGGASISGVTASLDMRGLSPGSGTYAFNDTVLNGPQLFDIANVIYVGSVDTGTGDGSSVANLINAAAADDLTTDANTTFVLVKTAAVQTTYTDADGFTLADGQSLVSFANGGTVTLGGPPANVTGSHVVTGATQNDPTGFGGATLNNVNASTIDLANGNLIKNLSVSNGIGVAIGGIGTNGLTVGGVTIAGTATGLVLDGVTGTATVDNLTIQAPGQTGIVLVNSAATVNFTGNTKIAGSSVNAVLANNFDGIATFDDLDITGGGTGIAVLGGSSGTFTFEAASSIANTGNTAVSINGSTPNFTYKGTIDQTSAASAVSINAMTGGSAAFAGLITANTGAANAIDLAGNTGGTINFTGGLDLTTDGGYGFSAIDGGTLTVTGSGNTVATGAGIDEKGILIGGTGMTIGAAGVSFASVTVDGSGGIVSSGIVIQNTTGGNVTFGAVDINRVNGDAIRLTNVSNAVTFNGTTKIDTVVANGPGFVVQGSSANVTVNNLVTTLVSGADVSLSNNSGTIGIGGTITNSGIGDGVVVFGGSAAITVSANIASSAGTPGTAVKVDGISGGSVAFSGNVTSTGTGNLFDIGSTLVPVGGAFSFTGPTLSATGGGGAVVAGLAGTATLNVTAPLSITNATATGLSVANVANTASATFGAVTVSGATGNGIDITNNAGAVTFGTTSVTMGSTVGPAGINFALTNADVTFGTTNVTLGAGANQTGIDFSGSSTTADFGLTTITGLGDLTSRGIDLSSTTGNKVITFLQGSKIDNVGVGVELSSGGTTATSANANFTFGDGDSTDGLESFISAAPGGFTVNTVGLDPALGNYDFDDVFFTGSANLATAAGSVTLVSQSGGFIAAGTTGNLSTGVNTISLAAADALTGAQNFAFVGTINLGATAFTLDSGQTIAGFGNGSVVSTGTIQPANVQGNLGATGGNITGDEAVVSGTANLMQLLGDNAVRNTAFDFSGATGSAFLIDQSAVGFSNAGGITIEGVTISNVAAGQTAIKVAGLTTNLSVINNNINVAGTLLDVNGGGTGTISVSRGFLPNAGPAGTLTGGGINIANRTGGSVTFTDEVTIGGTGVSLTNNTGSTVTFADVDITTNGPTAFSASGGGTVNVTTGTINATNAQAVALDSIAANINFASTSATFSSGNGVDLQNLSGTVALGTGTLTNTGAGTSFNVGSATAASGGNAVISYGGTIASNGTGAAVSIQELTGGSVTLSGNLTDANAAAGGNIVIAGNDSATITFSGSTKQISSGATDSVNIGWPGGVVSGVPNPNPNSAINFTNGGLDLTTTTGGMGFVAFGGFGPGTLAVTGSGNKINSGGDGLLVVGTNVGAGGITFDSISAVSTVNAAGVFLSGLNLVGDVNIGGLKDTGYTGALLAGMIGAGVVNFTGTTDLDVSYRGFDISGPEVGTINIANVAGSTLTIDGGSVGIATNGLESGTINVGGNGGLASIGATTSTTGSAITLNGGDDLVNATLNYNGSIKVDTGSVLQAGGGGDWTELNMSGSVVSTTAAAAPGTAAFTFSGNANGVYNISSTIDHTGTGIGVLFDGSSEGTATFSGTSKTFNTSGGTNGAIVKAPSIGLGEGTGTLAFTNGGLVITTSSGAGFTASTSGAGTVSVSGAGNTITTTNGTALNLTDAATGPDGVNFSSVNASFSGTSNGINLQNISGALNLGTGTLTNNGVGVAFNVGSGTDLSGGNAIISYAGNIVSNGGFGAAVSIRELTGGSVTLSGNLTDTNAAGGGQIIVANINNGTAATVTFSGATKQIQSGTTSGVNLVDNPNGTIDFSNGGLAINTSNIGFLAVAGGTVSVAGTTNTITSTGGALSFNAITIGSGINFNSVSTSGGVTTGIALANLGLPGGAINLGTVDLQGINSRGVAVTGTLGVGLNFNSLSIGLTSTTAVAFDLNGAQINAAITANDFDVINSIGAGTSIGVDLRGATGGQVVRLGDTVVGGASSSISGVNTGVFLDSATNLAFTYGDGETATDQNSTIGAIVGIDASSAPVAGTYNFQDVYFQSAPGLGFGVGKIYFVGASPTGDGTGRDQSNLATLSTAEAASALSDVLVLVNDGGVITAAGSNGNDTLALATGEQVRGFSNGNINLAMTVPSTIQLANNSIAIIDQTPDGAATLTTSAGSNAITLGASGNFIDGFILDGSPAGAARGIKDNGSGASGTIISHMTIQNFATAGVEITPSTSTGIDNVTFAGNASDVIVNALNTTISNVSSTGATGIAFDIRNATGTTTLANLNVTTASTGTGIVFGGASGPQGTIIGTNVDVTGGAGGGIKVIGGDAAIGFDAASFVGVPGTSTGTAVTITGRSGGSFGFAGSVVANGAASGISVSGATAANTVSFTGAVGLGTVSTLTGTAVSINNNATASTVSFSNLGIVTNGTTGFSASNGGTVNVTTGTVNSTGAQAIALNGIGAGVNFTSTTSTGGTNNVGLANVTGTVSLGSGALSGATGVAFLVGGGTANISYAGSVTKATAGNIVDISGVTGGTVALSGALSATGGVDNGIDVHSNTGGTFNFSGATKTLTTGANSAVSLINNTNAAINFTGGGLVINTTSGTGFNATGGGTLTVTGGGNTISTTSGVAVNMDTVAVAAGGVTFASTDKNAFGGTNAVILDTVTGTGTIDLGTGALRGGGVTGINGAVIRIGDGLGTAGSGGTAGFTYAGTITTGSGEGVDIRDRAVGAGNITLSGTITHNAGGDAGLFLDGNRAGTITFSGASKSIASGSANGVNLTDNTGATINFTNGGLAITTTSGVGFNATGGGTVSVQGSGNTIASIAGGTALNVANTTIGGSGLTFQSISTNGAVNGILLNNTGAGGGLTVTGVGATAGSGGTITASTGDGVSLTSTQNVSLTNMNITNSQGNGILGNGVNGLMLNRDTVSGNGNSSSGFGEGNIYLFELTGDATHLTTFNNLTVSNSYVHNVFIQNTGGTLADLVVTNSSFTNNGASTVAGDEFQIHLATGGLAGTPTATVHATNNTFSGNLTTPTTYTATGFAGSVDDGTLNVHLGDGTAGGLNTFNTNNSGITLTGNGSSTLNFDVNDNIVTNNRAVGIAINHFGTATVTGFLRNTTIGTQGVAGSGAQIGNGLDIHDEATSGTMTLSVTNNIVQSVGGGGLGFEGIDVQSGNGGQNSASTLNVTLTGNTIRDIVDDRGLFINNFNTAGNSVINVLLSGNTFTNANASGANTTVRVGGAPGGSDHVNVTQADAASLAAANGLTVSNSPGTTMRVDTNVFFNHAAPALPPPTP